MTTEPREKVPILLVDDQPANLLALEAVLYGEHYEIVTARSGAEAIEKIEHAEFAVVLLDILMPGLDGYETARRMKKLPSGRDVPLIFITAIEADDEHRRRGFEVGAADYFGKPFDPEVLRRRVALYAELYTQKRRVPVPAPPHEVAGALRRFADEILARWKRLVLEDPSVPEANRLSEPELRDHVPRLLERIANALEQPDERAALVGDRTTLLHARQRFDANYHLGETMRELSHLRIAILAVLTERGVDPNLASSHAIGTCLDEVMATGAVEMANASARALEQEARIRERFLAVIAHDLRQPLSAIMLGARSLLHDEAIRKARAADVVSRIARSAERMANLVRDLLDYARASQGEALPIAPADGVELRDLLRDIAEESAAAYPEATLRIEGASSVRGHWDPARLTQAITNLVSNAIVHGAPGRPIALTLGADDENAWVRVHNENRDGPIPREQIRELFSPFRRASGPSTHEGLGLGLYIASEVVRSHGGAIEVESGESGTTFSVSLPRQHRG